MSTTALVPTNLCTEQQRKAINALFEIGLNALIKEACDAGASSGTATAAVLVNGNFFTSSRPFINSKPASNDPKTIVEKSVNTEGGPGINEFLELGPDDEVCMDMIFDFDIDDFSIEAALVFNGKDFFLGHQAVAIAFDVMRRSTYKTRSQLKANKT